MATEWIDFKAVKAAVSMDMILGRYNVRLRKVNSTYLRGKCPLPTHTSKGSGDSFGTDTAKNIWACQSDSCVKIRSGKKGGNVIDFVAVMENCSIRDAALKIANWFNVSSPKLEKPAPAAEKRNDPEQLIAKEKRDVTESIEPDGENKPLGFALKNIDHSHQYLIARSIAPETTKHFGIGYFSGKGSMANRIVIPIHNEAGELIAYAGRSIDTTEPRYKLPSGFKKTKVLYNLNRVVALAARREVVIVVEGFFDCMKVHQAGYPLVVALMGSILSDAQEKILENFSRVTLMLDGDEPGKEAARAIGARLMYRTFLKIVNLPNGKQPDQLSSEELESILGSL